MLEENHPSAPYLTVADLKHSIRFYKSTTSSIETSSWRKPSFTV